VNVKTGNNLSDRQLVEKVLSGNTNAFEAVIRNTEGLVAQIVFKMINYAEERKDIAQDIYLKAFNKLPGFRFQSKLSTWIAQIAYNTCLSFLDKKKLIFPDDNHWETESDNNQLERISNRSIDLSESENDRLIFQKELSKILLSEIEKLTPIFKTLITLYHNEDMSYEEISVITELPIGTVKNYLFRARKTLKEQLLQQYKKEDLC
jgi:RNA polymerase sigma-70 factor (ECF subfamily)